MYNHVIKSIHQRNFLKKLNPGDPWINGLTKDKLLTEAAYQEDIAGGAEERDYGVIRRVSDFEEYMDLRNRPDNWSEKKAQMGVIRGRLKSNMDSMFDERSWAEWKPPTPSQVKQNLEADFDRGIKDVNDMVKDFNGKKDDKRYKEIEFYRVTYKGLLSFFGESEEIGLRNKIPEWQNKLKTLD